MNVQHDVGTLGRMADEAALDDPEVRLELNREVLRERLIEAQEKQSTLSRATHLAAPVMREVVREHPLASLTAAALVGVWVVRRRPWQALGGSLLAGLLARQTLALSLWSGNHLLNRLAAYKRVPGRPPES